MTAPCRVTVISHAPKERRWSVRLPRILRIVSPWRFLWVAGLVALIAGTQLAGLPHVLLSYEFTGSGYKTACTYFGPYSQTVSARNGECALLILLREEVK